MVIASVISPFHMSVYTPSVQSILRRSRDFANESRAIAIESDHLLAAITDSDTKLGQALRSAKITPDEMRTYFTYHRGVGKTDYIFHEPEIDSNFTSSVRDSIVTAYNIADLREDLTLAINEVDLYKALTGECGFRSENFPLIFRAKHIQPGTALRMLRTPSTI